MSASDVLTIHTDGASRGNPGPAAFAYVLERAGQPPIEEAGCLGRMTNNQAEYTALVRALEHALRLGAHHRLVVHSDSELMVKQMRGEYRVKDAGLRPLYEEACDLRDRFEQRPQFVHVRRELNRRADELGNLALDGKLPAATPAVSPDVGADPSAPPPLTVHDRALAYLTAAALTWAQGNPHTPTPAAVWEQLLDILREEGALAPDQ
jgi:ribonuclease HI